MTYAAVAANTSAGLAMVATARDTEKRNDKAIATKIRVRVLGTKYRISMASEGMRAEATTAIDWAARKK